MPDRSKVQFDVYPPPGLLHEAEHRRADETVGLSPFVGRALPAYLEEH